MNIIITSTCKRHVWIDPAVQQARDHGYQFCTRCGAIRNQLAQKDAVRKETRDYEIMRVLSTKARGDKDPRYFMTIGFLTWFRTARPRVIEMQADHPELWSRKPMRRALSSPHMISTRPTGPHAQRKSSYVILGAVVRSIARDARDALAHGIDHDFNKLDAEGLELWQWYPKLSRWYALGSTDKYFATERDGPAPCPDPIARVSAVFAQRGREQMRIACTCGVPYAVSAAHLATCPLAPDVYP